MSGIDELLGVPDGGEDRHQCAPECDPIEYEQTEVVVLRWLAQKVRDIAAGPDDSYVVGIAPAHLIWRAMGRATGDLRVPDYLSSDVAYDALETLRHINSTPQAKCKALELLAVYADKRAEQKCRFVPCDPVLHNAIVQIKKAQP